MADCIARVAIIVQFILLAILWTEVIEIELDGEDIAHSTKISPLQKLWLAIDWKRIFVGGVFGMIIGMIFAAVEACVTRIYRQLRVRSLKQKTQDSMKKSANDNLQEVKIETNKTLKL